LPGLLKEPVFDREKIFSSSRVTPSAGSGFRAVNKSPRHHWPGAAVLSILFALAGLRFTIHNYNPSRRATPLLPSPSCSPHGTASAAGGDSRMKKCESPCPCVGPWDSTSLDAIPTDAASRERDGPVDGFGLYPQIAGRALTEAAGDTRRNYLPT
jgi:hypothetical protein